MKPISKLKKWLKIFSLSVLALMSFSEVGLAAVGKNRPKTKVFRDDRLRSLTLGKLKEAVLNKHFERIKQAAGDKLSHGLNLIFSPTNRSNNLRLLENPELREDSPKAAGRFLEAAFRQLGIPIDIATSNILKILAEKPAVKKESNAQSKGDTLAKWDARMEEILTYHMESIRSFLGDGLLSKRLKEILSSSDKRVETLKTIKHNTNKFQRKDIGATARLLYKILLKEGIIRDIQTMEEMQIEVKSIFAKMFKERMRVGKLEYLNFMDNPTKHDGESQNSRHAFWLLYQKSKASIIGRTIFIDTPLGGKQNAVVLNIEKEDSAEDKLIILSNRGRRFLRKMTAVPENLSIISLAKEAKMISNARLSFMENYYNGRDINNRLVSFGYRERNAVHTVWREGEGILTKLSSGKLQLTTSVGRKLLFDPESVELGIFYFLTERKVIDGENKKIISNDFKPSHDFKKIYETGVIEGNERYVWVLDRSRQEDIFYRKVSTLDNGRKVFSVVDGKIIDGIVTGLKDGALIVTTVESKELIFTKEDIHLVGLSETARKHYQIYESIRSDFLNGSIREENRYVMVPDKSDPKPWHRSMGEVIGIKDEKLIIKIASGKELAFSLEELHFIRTNEAARKHYKVKLEKKRRADLHTRELESQLKIDSMKNAAHRKLKNVTDAINAFNRQNFSGDMKFVLLNRHAVEIDGYNDQSKRDTFGKIEKVNPLALQVKIEDGGSIYVYRRHIERGLLIAGSLEAKEYFENLERNETISQSKVDPSEER